MRIFLSCLQALRDHPVPSYRFWRYYFVSALLEAGHEVIEAPGVDWAEGLLPLSPKERSAWQDRTWGPTVRFIRDEHRRRKVDLFLSYLFPDQVEPSAVKAIGDLGIPTVNFFCDNIREFREIPEVYRNFNLHWVPEADARRMYAKKGLSFLYAPMPMWVRPGLRTPLQDEGGETLFVGSHDALREDLLCEAAELGLDLTIYGAGWIGSGEVNGPASRSLLQTLANQIEFLERHGLRGLVTRATYRRRAQRSPNALSSRIHEPIAGETYFDSIRRARVVLGINRCPSFSRSFSDPIRYSRLRDIEAPMLGACYLTENAPGVEDLYQIGLEIETYDTARELFEKSRALSADPARRKAMRKMSQERALRDHSLARTLARISEKLGISAGA